MTLDALGELKALFLFVHDLVTMCAPALTKQVFCYLFGASRIKPQLAIDLLCDLFDPSIARNAFWTKHPLFIALINYYLIPLIVKSLQGDTTPDMSIRPFLKLFARIGYKMPRVFSLTKMELNKVYIQLNNLILSENLKPVRRVILTETMTLAIATNETVIYSTLESDILTSKSPLGGDSPVKKSSGAVGIAESVVETICCYIHHATVHDNDSVFAQVSRLGIKSVTGGSGSNAFSILNSSSQIDAVAISHIVGVSVDLVLTFVDTVYRSTVLSGQPLPSALASTWPSILSCLVLVLSNTPDPMTSIPGVLASFEKLLFALAISDAKEGISACINSILKVKNIDKFILNLFHRMCNDPRVLRSVSVELWRGAVRHFEATSPPSLSPEESAMDAFFQSPPNAEAVTNLVNALLPLNGDVSPWMMLKLTQLLTSDSGLAEIQPLWTNQVCVCLAKTNIATTTAAKAVAEMVSSVAKAFLQSTTAAPHQGMILESLTPWAQRVPLRVVEILFEIVEASGHLLAQSGWTQIVSAMVAAQNAPDIPNEVTVSLFKLVELIMDEFMFLEKIKFELVIPVLAKTVVNRMDVAVTSSFKGISLVQKCAESLAKLPEGQLEDGPLVWREINYFFRAACLDSRSEVRNCAIKTVASIQFPPVPALAVLAFAVAVLDTAATVPDEAPTPVDGILVHHSRDTERKRWNESIVLMIKSIATSVKSTSSGDKELVVNSANLAQVMETLFELCEGEVVTASCKGFVEIWKFFNFEYIPIYSKLLKNETGLVLSQPTVPATTPQLLPLLIPTVKQPLDTHVAQELFDFFAATVTHPSWFQAAATPFPVHHLQASSTHPLWDRAGWAPAYTKEVEAYKSVLVHVDTPTGPIYSPSADAVKLDTFLNNCFTFLVPFCETQLIDLCLRVEVVFRNSFTLAIAIRVIEILIAATLSDEVTSRLIKELSELARTRNRPVAIASSDMWKLALQSLLILGTRQAASAAVRCEVRLILICLTSETDFTARVTDPIDYAVIRYTVGNERGWESSDVLTAWVKKQLVGMAESIHAGGALTPLQVFILVTVVHVGTVHGAVHADADVFGICRSVTKSSVEEIFGISNEFSEKLNISIFHPEIVKCLNEMYIAQSRHTTVVVAVLLRLHQPPITDVVAHIVKDTWTAVAGDLLRSDSAAVREQVSLLLLAIAPYITLKL